MLEPKLKTFFESYLTNCTFLGEGGFDAGEDGRGNLGGNLLLAVYSSQWSVAQTVNKEQRTVFLSQKPLARSQ